MSNTFDFPNGNVDTFNNVERQTTEANTESEKHEDHFVFQLGTYKLSFTNPFTKAYD